MKKILNVFLTITFLGALACFVGFIVQICNYNQTNGRLNPFLGFLGIGLIAITFIGFIFVNIGEIRRFLFREAKSVKNTLFGKNTICPNCGEWTSVGDYCTKCGKRLDNRCPTCGVENEAGSNYCKSCGTKLK